MKSAITLAQVPEAKAGPFVFHEPLAEGFASAAKHGYDSVELFFPGPDFITVDEVKALAIEHGLGIAAVGTGAGMATSCQSNRWGFGAWGCGCHIAETVSRHGR